MAGPITAVAPVATTPPSNVPGTARRRTRFYTVMGVVALAVAAAGFGPGMLNTAARKAPLTMWVGFHAALFTAWLLLFLAQTVLVGRGRMSAHRSLGYLGAAVALLMVGSGYATAVTMAQRGFDLSGDLNAVTDPHGFLVFQLGDLLSFAVLVAAAVAFRRRPEVHKRLMLLATVGSLMAAPLTHLLSHFQWTRQHPPVILVPLALLYSSSAVYDRLSRGRIHPVSLWVAVALFAWANLRAAVNPTPAWRGFARWIVSE